MSNDKLETALIFAGVALGVSILWYIPKMTHHEGIVETCKEQGYVSGAPFGEDIKCEEMKVKK